MTYGYGFHWPAWSSKPYLESPCGRIIWLTVENKLPYLYTDEVLSAAPAEEEDGTDADSDVEYVGDVKIKRKETGRVAVTTMNASSFNNETGIGNVPEVSMLSRRLTLDLHTREVLGEMNVDRKVRKSIKNGDNPLGGEIPGGPRDILTYFFTKQSASKDGEGPPTSHGKRAR